MIRMINKQFTRCVDGSTLIHWLKGATLIMLASLISPLSAEIQITDSHGKYRFAEPPKRIVALNWTLAEQMLELGETPIGMADIAGFRIHAKLPIIPETVIDVGQRLSPNLSAIRQLKPDIILIGYSQRSLLRPLSNIATVIYFKNFGKRYNNLEKSRERFLEMAKLFDKTKFAENKLRERDEQLAQLRTELTNVFPEGNLPTLQFTIPQNEVDAEKDKTIWIFGKNSLPLHAAQQLGLEVITPEETSQFGTAQISSADLKELRDVQGTNGLTVCQVYLSSYQTSKKLTGNTKPQEGCSFELDYQNAFGGAMSILYLGESIKKALKDSSNDQQHRVSNKQVGQSLVE